MSRVGWRTIPIISGALLVFTDISSLIRAQVANLIYFLSLVRPHGLPSYTQQRPRFEGYRVDAMPAVAERISSFFW